MRSLLISSVYFPPQVGGIARIMECLATALGPERLSCLTGVRGGADTVGPAGPRVYRRPALFSNRPKPVRALAWAATVGPILLRERPKAILLATADDSPYGLRFRRWLHLPYVIYAHGNEILGMLAAGGTLREKAWRAQLLQRASRIVAVSRFTASLVERAGVGPDRITVIYPGCDLTRFGVRPPDLELRRRVLGARHRDRVILTTGNLVARKGHDLVIQALARLRHEIPDVTYLIVGDGPFSADLHALTDTLGVRDRVVFAGRVSDADLPAMYSLGDVFIMASRERREEHDVEGFGLVYLEAGACGKPVIGGRSGGVPEAVVDGVTGLLVDPADPEDVARALKRLLTDHALAERLGRQGRERVVKEFTWARAADRMNDVLTTVANE